MLCPRSRKRRTGCPDAQRSPLRPGSVGVPGDPGNSLTVSLGRVPRTSPGFCPRAWPWGRLLSVSAVKGSCRGQGHRFLRCVTPTPPRLSPARWARLRSPLFQPIGGRSGNAGQRPQNAAYKVKYNCRGAGSPLPSGGPYGRSRAMAAVVLRLLGYSGAFTWKLRPSPGLRLLCHTNRAPLQAWPLGAGCHFPTPGTRQPRSHARLRASLKRQTNKKT